MFLIQLKHELWKLFGKKRTFIGFGVFLLAQNVVVLMFRFSKASTGIRRALEGGGYPAADFITAETIATIVVIPIAYLLLPLYVALVGGDLVAKEAEDGTLRMILARPVSRVRLLALKWLAGSLFALLLSVCLGVFGLAFASLWFPQGGLFATQIDGDGPRGGFSLFGASEGLWRYTLAHLLLATKAVSVMGLGFMFSCFNMKPAAATILALSVLFANGILMNIPWFADYKGWFITHHLNLWQWVFLQPAPTTRIIESLCLLAGFNVTFFAVGAAAFQVRDIKS
jgi:ABC-2 type transport system permease protein